MFKSYKIRIYPTKEQEQIFWKHIHACRYVWNWMLQYQQYLYENNQKYITAYKMMNLLTSLKNDGEHDWLYEVSNDSLQTVCKDLDDSFRWFFNHTHGHPKFKSKKKVIPKFPIRSNRFYFIDNKYLRIPSVGKVKYKTDFTFEYGTQAKFINARISYVNNKWMISFGLECDKQTNKLNDYTVGIDLGIKETMVVAYSNQKIVFHNINKSKRIKDVEKRITRLQKSISRKYEKNKIGNKFIETNNIKKEKQKIKKLYAKLTNIRTDYIHQCTSKIINLYPKRIVVEDLDVQSMIKNRYLSKYIFDQCFYKITDTLRYKCEYNGIEFIKADRWFPSSKKCSCCGNIKRNLKLSDRTYHCDFCGLTIDRDYQAAINLSRYNI